MVLANPNCTAPPMLMMHATDNAFFASCFAPFKCRQVPNRSSKALWCVFAMQAQIIHIRDGNFCEPK